MPDPMSWLKAIAAFSLEWRTFGFIAWVIIGAIVAYGTPYLKERDAGASRQPAPPTQQTITINGPVVGNVTQAPAPAPVAAPVAQTEGSGAPLGNIVASKSVPGLTIQVLGGTNIIQVTGDLSVKERDYELTNNTGGKLGVKIYLLFESAAWSSGSSSNLITHKNKEVRLADFLESKQFISALNDSHAIICLGLSSAKGSTARNLELSDQRAVYLCGLVSKRVEAIKREIPVFGLPLGYNRNNVFKENTKGERSQRSVVILGVQSASGSLENEAEQRRVIGCILQEDILDDFKFSDYSAFAPGRLLRYIRIKRGNFAEDTTNCSGG
jgi:hypothetical protein